MPLTAPVENESNLGEHVLPILSSCRSSAWSLFQMTWLVKRDANIYIYSGSVAPGKKGKGIPETILPLDQCRSSGVGSLYPTFSQYHRNRRGYRIRERMLIDLELPSTSPGLVDVRCGLERSSRRCYDGFGSFSIPIYMQNVSARG
jgi:hypothetical protein